MKKTTLKRFVVRKYIMAKSVHDALKIERRIRPDDIYVDEDWKRDNPNRLESCIGFSANSERDYED